MTTAILPLVLANLLSSGRLAEHELHGLGEDKLDCIKRAVSSVAIQPRSTEAERERLLAMCHPSQATRPNYAFDILIHKKRNLTSFRYQNSELS